MKFTPFHALHQRHGARLVDFAGYDMPVLYRDIVSEHNLVRKQAGMFDLCHMGRVRFQGPGAMALATRVQSQDVTKMPVGRTRYALLVLADGNVLDDILISREHDGFLLVINAGNRGVDLAFFHEHAAGLDVKIIDESERIAMLAVQGPKAVDILEAYGLPGARAIGYYKFDTLPHAGGPILVSRTGYTGEDGFELFFEAPRSAGIWDDLLRVGAPFGLLPCGLGARDTLRLEAGMPLYGHELDLNTNPYEARLSFGVSETAPFLGQPALTAIRKAGPKRLLVGLTTDGRQIPRQGCPVFAGDRQVGVVASGTLSPTLGIKIATAMVEAAFADATTPLIVDIRGNRVNATRVPMPFYRRQDRNS